MLRAEELNQLGQSRYGKHWQAAMARDICELTEASYNSTYMMLNRYANGKTEVPILAEAAIRLLCKDNSVRKLDILRLLNEMTDNLLLKREDSE